MIKTFSLALIKLTTFIFLLLVLSSCKELFFLKKKMADASEIRLIVFYMNVDTDLLINETEQEDSKKELVNYPFFDSMKFHFLTALIDEFNKNNQSVKLSPLSLQEVVALEEKNVLYSTANSTFSYFDPNYVFFSKNIVAEAAGAPKILQELTGDYFALLELNTHPWLQNVKGILRVYNKDKELVWSEKIKYSSGYIANDPKSPYLIKSREFKRPANSDSDHAKEMELLYTELAKKVALSFKDTLNKYF